MNQSYPHRRLAKGAPFSWPSSLKTSLACAAFLALASATELGWARKNGLAAAGCEGCHANSGAKATVTANPASFLPGADVTFSVAISAGANGTAAVGGIFVVQPPVGALQAIAGEGLTLTNGGLIHSTPKAAQAGVVTFRFGWRAPAAPAGLNLDMFVLAGNGDSRSSGDTAGSATFQAAFGCTARQFFHDGDNDGFGSDVYPSVVGCDGQPPALTSATDDDCDDNDGAVSPGAKELCNRRDDDCDGAIDEETASSELYPDDDGDGYYARNPVGPAVIGCLPMRGYAAQPGDCAPNDPKISPGAVEICNGLDDNCDGRVDERLRPQCGEGFCRRESVSCNPSDCTPGTPSLEQCNLLDDDCDGEVDEGVTCPAGQTCVAGTCSAGGTGAGGTTSTGGTVNVLGGAGSATQGGSVALGGMGGMGGMGTAGSSGSSAGSAALGGSSSAGNGDGAPNSADDTRSGGCTTAPSQRSAGGCAALSALLVLALALRKRNRRSYGP